MDGFLLDSARIAIEQERGIWADRVPTDYFDRLSEQHPESVAMIEHRCDTGRVTVLTYRTLSEQLQRIANRLASLGIGHGDVVSFQLPNWWQFVALYLACVRIGAVCNPLMTILRHKELTFMLDQTESKVFITARSFRGFDHQDLALRLLHELSSLKHVFVVGGDGELSFEKEFLTYDPSRELTHGMGLGPNDPMQLLYTSGTTGEPKGVLHTANTLIGTLISFAERMQFGKQEVVFMPSPIAHQIGFSYGVTAAVLLGAPLLIMDVWNAATAVDLMERHKATYIFAPTPFLADLVHTAGIEKRDLSALRLFVTSGAPVPPPLITAARKKLGTTLVAGWGMTECMMVTTTLLDGKKVEESDGFSLPGEQVRVVGADGRELTCNQSGDLQVRGASLFVGYLKRPNLYDVDADGWFNTGDLARMDEDGYIRITGRKKDIVIRGGENIPVIEVENAIHKMPEVLDVAIVGMPDPRLGERACAFVTPRPGHNLDLARVTEFLAAEGVAKHFWPERLELLSEMPHTQSGKIKKYELRDWAKGLSVGKTSPSQGEFRNSV